MDLCKVYISKATDLFNTNQLMELGLQSKQNNRSLGVTGLLIYSGKFFIQVLEGEHAKVELLYEKIKLDQRHSRCTTLLCQDIKERSFDKWHMGALDLTGHKDLDIETLENLSKHASTNPESTGFTALALLKMFRTQLPDPDASEDQAA